MTGDEWAPLADRFVEGHYSSLRGQVRTHVLHQHLLAHLPSPPAAVIDVGGGAGNQSIPLARLGYCVTIVDPSPAMLGRAASRVADEPDDVRERIRLVDSDADHAAEATGRADFEAVLCHGVIMYVDEPRRFLVALAGLAAPAGLVSVVAKNADSMAARPALEGRWAEALAAFHERHQVNGLGVVTRGDTVEELSEWLRACDVRPLAWYGVRLFTDGWTRDTPWAPSDQVFAVELEASRRDPYRRLSRLFHIVGERARGQLGNAVAGADDPD